AGNVMTHISNPYLNLDVYKTNGVDIEAAYDLVLGGGGSLGFRLFGTRTDEVTTVVAGTATDFAGVTGPGAFTQPEWALNGTVSYDRGAFCISAQVRYIDSGIYNVNWIEPGQPGYSPASPFSVNDNDVASFTNVTLSGRYELPFGERNWELFATINNLFDEDPPLAPDGAYPTNTAFFDLIGRAFRVGVRGGF